MTSRDWAWGSIPAGFKKVVDGRGGLMVVREDVAEFLTLEDCTQPNNQNENDRIGFQGRGKLRALRLRNQHMALIRPYRHGGLFRHLLGESFFTWPPRPFRELAITEETVKVHMRNILGKLSARDRTEAVTIALRRGIIQL